MKDLKTPIPPKEEPAPKEEEHHHKKQKVSQADQDDVENEMARKKIKEPEMPDANSAEETAADANEVESEISANTEKTKKAAQAAIAKSQEKINQIEK